jgi:hypothetical protein
MRRGAACKRLIPFLPLVMVFIFSGCLPVNQPSVDLQPPTAVATPVPSPTPTIQWFPPTATLPPISPPTAIPTEDMLPGLGSILFQDDFTKPQSWSSLGKSSVGSAAVENGSLTIALFKPKVRMISVFSKPAPQQAYIELTAQSNLCNGLDEYGLLFRYASNATLYRYTLSCDGQVQLVRIADGVTSFPQPWMPSGAVPLGAPGTTRLAVWNDGPDMRFFINDQYQFSVRDPKPISGRVGVFARSQSEKALSVSFSNLTVYAILPE